MAALRTSDTDLPNLSTSITPTGWINIHHVDQDGSNDQASSGNATKINGYSSNSGASKLVPTKNANKTALSTSLSSSSGEGFLDSLPKKGSGTQSYMPSSRTLHTNSTSVGAIPSGIPHATYSNIWKVRMMPLNQ